MIVLAMLAVVVPMQVRRWDRGAWDLARDGCWCRTEAVRSVSSGAPVHLAPDDAPIDATLIVHHSPRVAVVHADQGGPVDLEIHRRRVGRHSVAVAGGGRLCIATGEPVVGTEGSWQRFVLWERAADADRLRAIASLEAAASPNSRKPPRSAPPATQR